MSIEITEVRNAQSLNAENTAFELEINHPKYGWIPYGLMPNDEDTTVDNSVLLSLIGSDYAAYVAPTAEEITAELAASVRGQRDFLLRREVDVIVGNPLRWTEFTDAKRAEWSQYRTDLLNLPAQAGFPNTVTWPTLPT